MAKKNHELTEGEWAIITAVWDNEPCAAPTVQEELAARKKWTYSTVKTMMDRMVTKGLLNREDPQSHLVPLGHYQKAGPKRRDYARGKEGV